MNESHEKLTKGTLYLVATPIGNLGDISRRACEVLESVEVIACEDTRRTGKLLELLGLRAQRLMVANEHTEASAGATIVALLEQGQSVALVSDAGTPAISDPGQRLVRYVVEHEHRVSAVPGPSAVTTALTLSGLSTDRWAMEGFLPRKGLERDRRLAAVASDDRTTVIFESPKRLKKTLADLATACGSDRQAAVMRELTKLFEESVHGSLAELSTRFSEDVKGEVVIVVGAAPQQEISDETIIKALEAELTNGATKSGAVSQVTSNLGVARNRVYSLALEIGE
ncbi:MAG TPA: 16S rRNA (cytidine(1402)-2'-O)-methyltransferase [Acidimicrobiales bacterium]|jgi:16S rRNA (cytidine1402-2'-O)-methyltransferase|nr:16S rRNA (cytidine(1402)-2'-O)-methyltransferase [Acidimicrobiales bacterium]